ncbi:hypothetical protein H072_7444 [Dactylellina haptotyla CBS 200.50]|uniref:C2H2-type domain-containing protein n=1 Tax=Dactylellina haptotyla (strain CBS 200.50) TaxID=1284197 RepID=S8A754_DACHA|nr:hypothetical protein H072_7444 [Dactylellina haptotyla CBS 200.50]
MFGSCPIPFAEDAHGEYIEGYSNNGTYNYPTSEDLATTRLPIPERQSYWVIPGLPASTVPYSAYNPGFGNWVEAGYNQALPISAYTQAFSNSEIQPDFYDVAWDGRDPLQPTNELRKETDHEDSVTSSPNPSISSQTSTAENETSLLGCDKCGFKTHLKSNLTMHKRRVHSGKRYPCTLGDMARKIYGIEVEEKLDPLAIVLAAPR